jgi:hypothetical protein
MYLLRRVHLTTYNDKSDDAPLGSAKDSMFMLDMGFW